MKLKRIIYTLAILLCLSTLASCVTHSHGRGHRGMPPGKAKKIYGTKSAKPFAPGQQKKKHSNLKKKKKNHKGPQKHRAKKQNRHSVYFVPVWKY